MTAKKCSRICWQYIIYDYGYLGEIYFQQSDTEKAVENLKHSAELAVKFDSLDRITVMHSKLFEGRKFDKHSLGDTYCAAKRVRTLMTEKYPLSDEFKETEEFKDILNILG